jgi:RimJ/RimL family protein N-acetyltransferase
MLELVTAAEASTDAFLSVSAGSRFQGDLKEYLDSLLRQRFTKPEWCVLGTEAGVPTARAALWALAGQKVPTDIVLIDADWGDETLSAGHAVLTRVEELALELGAEGLSHHVDSPPGPPQYQEDEEARIRLLARSGWALLRDGLRWRHSPSLPHADLQESALVFRPLPEVGEDVFVDAIAATYEGTLDSWLGRGIQERGLRGAARADFLEQQGLEHLPEWWELAYAEEGELVGVIMAARNPNAAVIAYVGVVAEQRGRGFAATLVRRGTEHLVGSGAEKILGDCDRGNVAMVKAFERAGYEQFARRRSYHRSMTPKGGSST